MNKVILSLILGMMLIAVTGFIAADYGYGSSDNSGNYNVRTISRINERLGTNYTLGELRNKSTRFEVREQIKELKGNRHLWLNIYGRNISIMEISDGRLEIITEKINAKTGLNLTTEEVENGTSIGTILRAYLSNGRWAEVRYMPDKASEIAQGVLREKCEERNCTIRLVEVGKEGSNNTILAYEISTDSDTKVLFFFKKKMPVMAQVNAETGEVISVKRPWWSFLATTSVK